jgi:hypothetical protein
MDSLKGLLLHTGRHTEEPSGNSQACDTLVWNLDPSGDFLEAPQQPAPMVRDTSASLSSMLCVPASHDAAAADVDAGLLVCMLTICPIDAHAQVVSSDRSSSPSGVCSFTS